MFALSSPLSANVSDSGNTSSKEIFDVPKATDLGDGSSDTSPIRLSAGGGSGLGVTNEEMETIGKIAYKRSLHLSAFR